MMHRARSSIVEMPYCFSRSSVKFQGHTALKIVEFDPKWAFPDCNSSLKSPMAMKCCTKLETAKERCPIVFQGHLSNFKVTRYKTSPILTQIGRFRTIGQSQLSNPSDLPCLFWKTAYTLVFRVLAAPVAVGHSNKPNAGRCYGRCSMFSDPMTTQGLRKFATDEGQHGICYHFELLNMLINRSQLMTRNS